jgi:ketosteroid isomerase-like protein
MKQIFLLVIVLIAACSGKKNQELTMEEKNQVKQEIIQSYEKHIQDLKNLDYEEVMKYYANVEDHVLFGDGLYWGNYETINQIWKSFCTQDNKLVTKWDLIEHHIYVFSREAASYLVQFDNERIQSNGDTTKVTGCFSYGMQKFDDGWKVVTTHVTHNYKPGYDPRIKK